jgi:hypothetical protein
VSSIDPAISAAQALLQAVDSALADAALNLGAEGEAIAAQLQVGDLFPAIVLAPQAGTDLLQIFGQPVAAQLPPGIHPGETIVLQVNGFDGNRILVNNLGVADPNNPPDLAQIVVPQPATGEPAVVATLTTIPPPTQAPAAPAQVPATQASTQSNPSPQPQPVAQAQPPTAPPREVFVAASVRPASPVPPSNGSAAVVTRPAPMASDNIEARMGATRTSPSAPPQAPTGGRVAATPVSPVTRAVVPPGQVAGVRPQQSVPLAALLTPALKIPISRRAPVETAQAPQTPRAQGAPPSQAPRTAPAGDPAAVLLARIRVPQTTFSLAAARVANEAVASIPRVFARLEAALPQVLPAAAIPLRALMTFVSKLDLANTRVLPEQIAAFVSHVVDGAEPKLAQALSAYREADLPAETEIANQSTPANDANARAIERTAAFDFDLKSALVALSQSTQGESSPQLARAVSDALTATTGVQFSALSNAASDPTAITIALPAFFYDGGRPAEMRIDRDAPNGREPLDADNFRIGFVLDTASLGTIAIDVETVGRTVRVDVRTERTLAATRITDTLPDLRARFEQLRYRVAAMTAGTIPPRAGVAQAPPSAPPSPRAPDKTSGLDLQA